jgi:hypothetical protein
LILASCWGDIDAAEFSTYDGGIRFKECAVVNLTASVAIFLENRGNVGGTPGFRRVNPFYCPARFC